ncbi:MAG TPA: hypothetical protein VJN88_00800 [Ktedonobacterales bacterium]|nr:hypothetical protein [Ktedonobacterales bacterium]
MERQTWDDERHRETSAEDDDTVSRAPLADGRVMEVKSGNLAAAKDALAARKAVERAPSDATASQIDPEDFRSVAHPHAEDDAG